MPQVAEENLLIDLSVLDVEPADEYHAKAGEYLSSHQLMDFMSCPWLYRKKQLGLITDTDSPALLIGRATHVRILEGRDVYESQFALGGPINPRLFVGIGQDSDTDCQICSYCGQIKPFSEFNRHKRNALGIGRECRECRRKGRLLAKEYRDGSGRVPQDTEAAG